MGNEQYQQYIENELIKIRFDKYWFGEFTGIRPDSRKEDEERYFKLHPRSKYLPMEYLGKKRTGVLPSLNNVFNVASRQIQNNRKQDFSNYTEFCVKGQRIPRAYLDKCIIVVKHIHGTKTRFDVDNIYIKPVLDCLVKLEVLKEDNYNILPEVTLWGGYEKDNDYSEIYILPFNEDYSVEWVMEFKNQLIQSWTK